MFKAFHARQPDGAHYVAVTDPGSSMEQTAKDHGFRKVFYGDPDIGGRYSALSNFGIVPAAAAGIDIGAVLDSAIGAAEECREPSSGGPVARRRAGRARPPGPRQADLRGRHAAGQLRPVGRAAVRGVDRQAGHGHPPDRRGAAGRRLRRRPRVLPPRARRRRQRRQARRAQGRPATRSSRSSALGPVDLGRIFFISEFAVAVAGWALEINPFDQPNVQEAKDNTNRVLKEGSGEIDPGSLSELTDGLAPPALFRDHGLPAVLERGRRGDRARCAPR